MGHLGFFRRIAAPSATSLAASLAFLAAAAAPLAAQSPVKLFDGTSLKGWKVLGDGSWTVSNGEIVARQSPSNPHFTHLVQDTVLKDFRISFLFRSVKGNAGFFFRQAYIPSVPDSLAGVQVVIDPALKTPDAFGLYETNGRLWLKKWNYAKHANQYPNAGNCMMKWDSPVQAIADTNCRKTLYNPAAGAWNRISVWAKGPRVIVKLNMRTIVDTTDPKLDRPGRFAFKLHQAADVEIRFKDVELAPLLDFPAGLRTKLQKVLLYKGEAGVSPEQLREFAREVATENGIDLVEGVEADFNRQNLAQYQAALFLSDYNVRFNAAQKADFESWFKQDHGALCLHACTRQEITMAWPWWGDAMGGQLAGHTLFKERAVALDAEAAQRPLWKSFDTRQYAWKDEWYRWITNPRGKPGVTALLSYADDGIPADQAPKGLPHAWIKTSQGGRFLAWGGVHTMNGLEHPITYDFILNALREAGGYDSMPNAVKPVGGNGAWRLRLAQSGDRLRVEGVGAYSIELRDAAGRMVFRGEGRGDEAITFRPGATSGLMAMVIRSGANTYARRVVLAQGRLTGG